MKHCLQLLSLMIVAACATLSPNANRLDVTLSDITPLEIGFLEQQYQVSLRVQNPSDTPVVIDGFAYQIEINDKAFARGVSDESATVPRFGQVVLSAKAVSGLSAVVDQIRKLKGGPPDAVRYRVTGKFALSGGGSVPFDQRGEIGF
jgi:LEA14-like dessication related protein